MTPSYSEALKRGRRLGAGVCEDADAMALFCDAPLQLLVGAVSPRLVWGGAMTSGLTLVDLSRMCASDPRGVEGLMWL